MQDRFRGATVEEAVQQGLKSWHVDEQQVKIEVEDQGKKGLFGFGRREAIVSLTIIDPELKKYTLAELKNRTVEKEAGQENEAKDEPEIERVSVPKKDLTASAEKTLSYVVAVLEEMNISASGEVIAKGNEVTLNLVSEDAARIIGKRGHVLNALQVIAQTYIQQVHKGYITLMLDIENYREKRKEILENLALNMANKALDDEEMVKFEPMPNYERKIIHQVLGRIPNIETYSEGREPHRYLVIRAKPHRQ
ncbi:protein jag [Macrococcus hajekii]|uniref:RNA-binding protein KhpB n=1 Tax=Macrococcus hajekii TaxID=198482 RepID=A0A4R6BK56_9STAP|nr:RNA-binding cell elongation regulator Jag/EloR [Macrococcus hajekii]TDM02047.1 protein jag [Macrococcus hajekii]GGB09629.1 RNA-binding protein Jag [Macrococcus hajekii]